MISRNTFNLALFALGLSGCLGDEGSTTATTGDPAMMDLPSAAPLTRSEFCPAVADALCLARATCCRDGELTSCLVELQEECRALYAPLFSSPAFSFDESRAGGLVELIRRDANQCRPSIQYHPMPGPGFVLAPALREGDPCGDGSTAYGCVESTFCDQRNTGLCQPRKPVDMPCFRDGECQAGLACSYSDDGSAGHCVARAGRAQVCRDRPCEGGLTCSRVTGRCVDDAAEGERCDDRPCEQGLVCAYGDPGETEVPRCRQTVAIGSPCDYDLRFLCGPGALCEGSSSDGRGTCVVDSDADYPAPRDGVCNDGHVLDSFDGEPYCVAHTAADAFCR
jgi:hypothetical protein